MNDPKRPADDKATQIDGYAGAPTAITLYLTALGQLRAGHPRDAEASCRDALALDGAHADTLHLMGLLPCKNSDTTRPWIGPHARSGRSRNPCI
jgi:hypothetical protein